MAIVMASWFVAPAHGAMTSEKREAILADATAAYDQGASLIRSQPDRAMTLFQQAIDAYEKLIADGVVNGRLYYNLGNAYLQIGEVGKAIVNYRRAQRLMPGDPQLEHNLRHARSLRRNNIESEAKRALLRTAFFWHYNTSIFSRYWVAVVGYVVFWCLMLLGIRVRGGLLRNIALAILPIWLAAGVSVGVEYYQRSTVKEGVTTSAQIVVRKGNGDGYDPQFAEKLHEGVEFTVLEQRAGWYKIQLPDGGTGWIRTEQAELI